MNFRHDINALRAVAVLAVLLFHFEVPGFGGGYIGVDIFFVISGFLMTAIICSGISQGTFGFLEFYAARARRIVPALLLMVIVLLGLGSFWLIPFDYAELGRSCVAALGFYSNMLFAQSAGYFDSTSQNTWLLHTWSLGVEWQFYLLFPLYAVWLSRWKEGRYRHHGMGVLFAVSFFLSLVLTWKAPTAAFFILPTRIWEFLAGGFVFLYGGRVPKSPGLLAAGAVCMLAAIVFYTESMAFPGLWAVLPAAGAALWIMSGSQNIGMQNAAVQRIGTVSYSLYLWHWPVVVGMKYLEVDFSPLAILAGLALSFLLAEVSYRWVEQLFRRGRKKEQGSVAVLLRYGAALLMAGLLAGGVALAKGIPARVPAPVLQAQQHEPNALYTREGCQFNYKKQDGLPECRIGSEGQAVSIALWGDSHAGASALGVEKVLQAAGRAAYVYAYAGCPPVLGVRFPHSSRSARCNAVVERTHGFLKDQVEIKQVALISRWPVYRYGYNEGSGEDMAAVFEHGRTYAESIVETACTLQRTGKQVFLFMTVPEMGKHVPLTLAKHLWLQQEPGRIGVTSADYQSRNAVFKGAFTEAAQQCGARVVDTSEYLCRDGFCNALHDGKPLYVDDDHLSMQGNDVLGKAYMQLVLPVQ